MSKNYKKKNNLTNEQKEEISSLRKKTNKTIRPVSDYRWEACESVFLRLHRWHW